MKKLQVADKVWNGLTLGRELGKTILSLQGSSRSAKTYNILIYLIVYLLQNPGTRLSIVRKTLPAIKGSVLIDFKEIMLNMDIWEPKQFNKTELIYWFSNGSWVEFFSTDNEQKIRGRKRDILFVNEANEISLLEWTQLKMRTTRFSILDYNPSFSEDHWLETENKDPDTHWFISTYKDNPFLEQKIIDDIEKLKDKNKSLWTVYGLGLRAVIEGRIFKEYEIVDGIPDHVRKRWIGQDFGYTNDPTSINHVAIDGTDLYIDEICYRTHMLTGDIIKTLKKPECLPRKVISESADPRLIDEIHNAGINIHAVEKYAGSVNAGLSKMQEFNIKITKRSTNVKKELDNYVYQQDKEGKWLNVPVDDFNHCFAGETLIKTSDGFSRIDLIKVNDLVLTTMGYKAVNKVHQNGLKKICNIKLIFATFAVNIRATPDHKFKTAEGWKKLNQLTKGDVLFTLSNLTEKGIATAKQPLDTEASGTDTRCLEKTYGRVITGKPLREQFVTLRTRILLILIYQISKCLRLKKDVDYQSRNERILKAKSLTEKHTINIAMKGIFQKGAKDCTVAFGNSIKELYQKGSKFITKILIRITTALKTLNAYNRRSTKGHITKAQVLSISQTNNLNISQTSGIKQKLGMQAKKGVNGIQTTAKRLPQICLLKNILAKYAVMIFSPKGQEKINSAQITVNLNSEDYQESTMKQGFAKGVEQNLPATSIPKPSTVESNVLEEIQLISVSEQEVYDLEVSEQHEYFANGILVHNCIDSVRYVILSEVIGKNRKKYNLNQLSGMLP